MAHRKGRSNHSLAEGYSSFFPECRCHVGGAQVMETLQFDWGKQAKTTSTKTPHKNPKPTQKQTQKPPTRTPNQCGQCFLDDAANQRVSVRVKLCFYDAWRWKIELNQPETPLRLPPRARPATKWLLLAATACPPGGCRPHTQHTRQCCSAETSLS